MSYAALLMTSPSLAGSDPPGPPRGFVGCALLVLVAIIVVLIIRAS